MQEDDKKGFIMVRYKGDLIKILMEDICYIQALGDYVNIYTSDLRHTIHITLKEISDKLPQDQFMRIHRSYIVNVSKSRTRQPETAYVRIGDKEACLPIGPQYQKTAWKTLA